jgi:hypothetical protein
MILNSISDFTGSSSSSSSSTNSSSSSSSSKQLINNEIILAVAKYKRQVVIGTGSGTGTGTGTASGAGSGSSAQTATQSPNNGQQTFATPSNPFGGSGSSASVYGSNPLSNTNTNALALVYLDIVTFVLLGIEFIIRTIIHPNKIKMVLDLLFYVDLIAIWPYFIYLMGHSNTGIQSMYYIFQIFRVFLLLKFFRHLEVLQILADTIIKSYKEMAIYMIYLALGVLFFSSFLYYIESSNSSTIFYTIPGIRFMFFL